MFQADQALPCQPGCPITRYAFRVGTHHYIVLLKYCVYPTAIGWESSDTPEEKARQLGAWQTVQRGHAVANGLPVIAVNRCGHEADPSGMTNGIQFWGHSFVAGPQGEFIADFGENEQCEVIEVSLKRSETVRQWWPFLRDRRIEEFGALARRFLDGTDQ